MKSLLVVAVLFGFQSVSFAKNLSCEFEAQQAVEIYGNRNDRPSMPEFEKVLRAGTTYQQKLGPYPEDTLVFINSGSYHSGWFTEAFILDQNCVYVEHALLYGE